MATRNAFRLFAVSLVLMAGCTEGEPLATDPCLGFTSTLAIKDRMDQAVDVFNSGEDIRFELKVTNNNPTPQTLYPSWSCSAAVFAVTDSNQQQVWRSDRGYCAVGERPRTYAPYETVSHTTQIWQAPRPALPNLRPIGPPGRYTIAAVGGHYAINAQDESLECRAALSKTGVFTIL